MHMRISLQNTRIKFTGGKGYFIDTINHTLQIKYAEWESF